MEGLRKFQEVALSRPGKAGKRSGKAAVAKLKTEQTEAKQIFYGRPHPAFVSLGWELFTFSASGGKCLSVLFQSVVNNIGQLFKNIRISLNNMFKGLAI